VRNVIDDRKFSFTDTRLERWEADPEREVCLYDADKPNLVRRISPSGAKTFYFWRTDRTAAGGGKASRTAKRRIGLLDEMTVEQARREVDLLNGDTAKADGAVPSGPSPTATPPPWAMRSLPTSPSTSPPAGSARTTTAPGTGCTWRSTQRRRWRASRPPGSTITSRSES
jgi:hypothetical protein